MIVNWQYYQLAISIVEIKQNVFLIIKPSEKLHTSQVAIVRVLVKPTAICYLNSLVPK